MTRAEKTATIEALTEKLQEAAHFYLADSSTLTVEQVNKFRGMCFEKGIEMRVVKNTLIKKAMEAQQTPDHFEPLFDSLKGPTAILFAETANAPAKVIKDFRGDKEKPALKAAYIDTAVFLGDEKLEELSKLKSKEELLGEVISLLQSPARNVISALQSGGTKIMGLLQALEEREEQK